MARPASPVRFSLRRSGSCGRSLCLLGTALLLAACSAADSAPSGSAPSGSAMVATANPYATEAAHAVLAAGGHAVDAAIAAHTVLGLVEPQSSGIGGGGFMLVYDAASGAVTAYNGRETAPAAIDDRLFAAPDGGTLGFREAWQSGRATGVPGAVALYAAAHADHGRLDWPRLFEAATALARSGFTVSPRLAGFLPRIARFARLDEDPAAAAYFFPGGTALAAGDRRDNPAYADTLARIARDGRAGFYTGPVAEAIVAATQAAPLPGALSLSDLASYQALREPALCQRIGRERLCTAPPPSSGLAVLMTVALYDRLASGASDEAARLAAFVDAQRLAYADRDHYVGDPAFGSIPSADLLQPAYLDARAGQRFAAAAEPTPGDPGAVLRGQPLRNAWGQDRATEAAATTHLSVVDGYGNAVAFTASVEAPFGNSRFVNGFLLNNQLTDFRRDADGKAHANAPAGGKRPRSSMSPLIAFDASGALRLVNGSPGGNSIIAYVARATLGVLRWQQAPDAAVSAPNIVARGRDVRVEITSPAGRSAAQALAAAGYPVVERDGENSGLHLIEQHADGLRGAADPRREGTVAQLPEPAPAE